LAEVPIAVFFQQDSLKISRSEVDYLNRFDVNWFGFQADAGLRNFPFGVRVQAAYEAEKRLKGETELLAWLDRDTLVINEPVEFLLPSGIDLGYRPVHHRMLGTPWGEDLDRFWELVYRKCGAVFDPNDFMITHCGEKIRPYFNAGSTVIRPEAGLMERWWDTFHAQCLTEDFLSFYDRDRLYSVFVHQAILTGVILAALDKNTRREFSGRINYPLHLHQDIPEDLRIESINDLITVRCESILEEPGWQDSLPIHEPLLSWLKNQLEMKKDMI
jgi:hypothetical protein